MEIKYAFAYDGKGQIKHIKSLLKDKSNINQTFTCINCSEELIPKMGEQRKWHFCHKPDAKCSLESYLHKAAKRVFIQEYNECLNMGIPFFISLQRKIICNACENEAFPCVTGKRTEKHDLTEVFNLAKEETRYEELIPDVLLESDINKDIVFIEFAVTHKCSEDKIKSGNRIIEITIKNEKDIEKLRNRILIWEDKRVNFINFNISPLVRKLKNKKNCNFKIKHSHKAHKIEALIVYKTHKCIIREFTINEFNLFFNSEIKDKILHIELLEPELYKNLELQDKYEKSITSLKSKGKIIKNCFNCKFCGGNNKSEFRGGIYCYRLKGVFPPGQAIECSHFFVEKKG